MPTELTEKEVKSKFGFGYAIWGKAEKSEKKIEKRKRKTLQKKKKRKEKKTSTKRITAFDPSPGSLNIPAVRDAWRVSKYPRRTLNGCETPCLSASYIVCANGLL